MTTTATAIEFKKKLENANNTLLVRLQGIAKKTYHETEKKTHQKEEQELSNLISELNKA